ncbi:MAG TPA: ArsA family ATPase [Gemmatimonadaceae bacterium]|nr:ArsA family ATPase [Gemmatimonadaceae bacterium]
MSALDALLDRLPRTTLVVGKGGVGKTTVACGIAAQLARRGQGTLLLSTDPAAALASVLGAPVGEQATSVEAHLDARQLDASRLRGEFLARWRDTIAEIIDRGTYLDRGDVDGLVDAALPGADEIFALLALADLLAAPGPYERIVVDTAPTGHTLRLLALPDTFRALLSMLDLMQGKHRFMVRALTHRYRRDAADDFLDDMRVRIDGLRAALADPGAVAAVVVARAEPVVVVETARYVEQLRALRVSIASLIVNRYTASGDPATRRADAELDARLGEIAHIWIPRAPEPPRGLAAVCALVESMRDTRPADIRESSLARAAADRGAAPESLVRRLTVVAGKGGVGKSTVACALAVAAADHGDGDVLLVSTDPAPSLADALGESEAPWAHDDVEHRLATVPALVVRQMDATAAFARLRDEYRERIDALFDSLVGRGVDVEADRAIVRDLLALAPPGIDEVFALSILGDALADRRFERIIVDPAPTGHLLRLLDMPAIALDWSHRLMRLMLKYQKVVGLGDSARELLEFAKRTRALSTLLHDRAECGVVIVALDEPVVRSETERLAAAVRARGLDLVAVLWNRLERDAAPLPATLAARQFFADEASPPPVGAHSLRAWSRTWREHVTTS